MSTATLDPGSKLSLLERVTGQLRGRGVQRQLSRQQLIEAVASESLTDEDRILQQCQALEISADDLEIEIKRHQSRVADVKILAKSKTLVAQAAGDGETILKAQHDHLTAVNAAHSKLRTICAPLQGRAALCENVQHQASMSRRRLIETASPQLHARRKGLLCESKSCGQSLAVLTDQLKIVKANFTKVEDRAAKSEKSAAVNSRQGLKEIASQDKQTVVNVKRSLTVIETRIAGVERQRVELNHQIEAVDLEMLRP